MFAFEPSGDRERRMRDDRGVIDAKLALGRLFEIEATEQRDAAIERDGPNDDRTRRDGAFGRSITDAERRAFEPRALERTAQLLGDRPRRHPPEIPNLHLVEGLALARHTPT